MSTEMVQDQPIDTLDSSLWFQLLAMSYDKLSKKPSLEACVPTIGEIVPLYVEIDGVRYDVYNITREFVIDGRRYILGRVELRDSEDSKLFLFRFDSVTNTWEAFDLEKQYQDPAIFQSCNPEDPSVGSGVKVEWAIDANGKRYAKDWRTQFHALEMVNGIPVFGAFLFQGPEHMKDMRLFNFKTPHGIIYGMLLRPTGGIYEGGRIKVLFGRSLKEIGQKMTPEYIEKAQMIPFEIAKSMWLGGNQADVRTRLDENGTQEYFLCIPLHTGAYIDPERTKRQYILGRGAAQLFLAPNTEHLVIVGDCSSIHNVAVRAHFPKEIPAKNDGLYDVVFNGGENEDPDGSIHVFCGVSDTTPCKRRTSNNWSQIIWEIQEKRRRRQTSPPSYSKAQLLRQDREQLLLPERV